LDSITEQSDELAIRAIWVIPAPRRSVYAIASDFERFPSYFPKLARSARVTSRSGDQMVLEVEAASFGRFFPTVRITIHAELLPGVGYRCSTFNHTFGTTGREEFILSDAPEGTQISYTYFVKVRRAWLRPLYGWLVRRFASSYWKRHYLDPLTQLARNHEREVLSKAGGSEDA
jgi:hypothetical protein